MIYVVTVFTPAKDEPDRHIFETYDKAMERAIDYAGVFHKYAGCRIEAIPQESGQITFVCIKENYPPRYIHVREEKAQ